jgi:hypothetical protein
MKAHELRTLIPSLLDEVDFALTTATTAEKGSRSLGGSGHYADKFHENIVKITSVEKKVRPHLSGLHLAQDDVNKFDKSLEVIKATSGKVKARTVAIRELKLLCETIILPKLDNLTASPIPTTESVLTMDIVKTTRGYLEEITIQINGCYEHQWYDACSVMIRKLAEILIIAVYEKHGVSGELKDANDNFHMLSKLVQLRWTPFVGRAMGLS